MSALGLSLRQLRALASLREMTLHVGHFTQRRRDRKEKPQSKKPLPAKKKAASKSEAAFP